MSTDTEENPINVLLDTNILLSAILFGGKPQQIVDLVLEERLLAFISPPLLAELQDVLNKKFKLERSKYAFFLKSIKDLFIEIYPKQQLDIVRDRDDNRVLEAAIEGKCSYIVTGDKDLLDLKIFKNMRIVTPDTFLSSILVD